MSVSKETLRNWGQPSAMERDRARTRMQAALAGAGTVTGTTLAHGFWSGKAAFFASHMKLLAVTAAAISSASLFVALHNPRQNVAPASSRYVDASHAQLRAITAPQIAQPQIVQPQPETPITENTDNVEAAPTATDQASPPVRSNQNHSLRSPDRAAPTEMTAIDPELPLLESAVAALHRNDFPAAERIANEYRQSGRTRFAESMAYVESVSRCRQNENEDAVVSFARLFPQSARLTRLRSVCATAHSTHATQSASHADWSR